MASLEVCILSRYWRAERPSAWPQEPGNKGQDLIKSGVPKPVCLSEPHITWIWFVRGGFVMRRGGKIAELCLQYIKYKPFVLKK